MSYIYKQKVGKYAYFDVVDSVWDPVKKKKKRIRIERIGKLDDKTGDILYKDEYLQELEKEGESTDGLKIWIDGRKTKKFTKEEVIDIVSDAMASINSGGIRFFFDKLCKKIGLNLKLQLAFPQNWNKLLTLAIFLLTEHAPFMKCRSWVVDQGYCDIGSMASQRISEMLAEINKGGIIKFLEMHMRDASEREHFIVDGTTISTESENIEYAEMGKNKDNDNLKQVNICMIFGTDFRVPYDYLLYNGSITDNAIFSEVMALLPKSATDKRPLFICDRGFWSLKNVTWILSQNCDYLLPVVFNSHFAWDILDELNETIDNTGQILKINKKLVLYKTIKTNYAGQTAYVHAYFDRDKHTEKWMELFYNVNKLYESYKEGSEEDINKYIKYKKYLNFDTEDENEVSDINRELMLIDAKYEGWFMLCSNIIISAKVAKEYYDERSEIEVKFNTLKNMLGLHRLHVQSNKIAEGKCFVAFLALLLDCILKNTLSDKEIKLNVGQLFDQLKLIREITIFKIVIWGVLTKLQKSIFKAFNIETKDITVDKQ
jgi:transposase